MPDLSVESRVDRPADEVWAALADFGGIARWAPNVSHSCLTGQQVEGVGTERRVQVGRDALIERVTEWAPGERLAYTVEGLPPIVRSLVNAWTLEEHGSSTTVTLTSRVSGPLAGRLLAPVLRRSSRHMLAGLERHLENER